MSVHCSITPHHTYRPLDLISGHSLASRSSIFINSMSLELERLAARVILVSVSSQGGGRQTMTKTPSDPSELVLVWRSTFLVKEDRNSALLSASCRSKATMLARLSLLREHQRQTRPTRRARKRMETTRRTTQTSSDFLSSPRSGSFHLRPWRSTIKC